MAACLGDVAQALDPHRALSQYVHDRWGPEQGLPRGTVHAITQSADGYLWVGTEAGLVRFDGWRFQAFAEHSGDAAPGTVLGLVPDREGGLWVRLLGPRLLRFRNDSFDYPPSPLPNLNVTAISRTGDGALMASAPERGTFVQARGGFERLTMAAALPRSPVTAVAQTTDGTVWVGTRDAGLFRISGGQVSVIADGLPDAKVNCLLPGRDGALWIGTDNGVVRWGGGTLRSVAVGRSQRRLQVLALAEDRDGNLWAGTHSSGLLRVNDRGVTSLATGPSGANDAVTSVFEDREGSLWIGTAGGLERLRDSAFVTYSLPEGLPADGGTPVFVDPGNRMWFGPAQGGLHWAHDGRSGRVSGGGLETDVVYSIAGRDGEVWVGRQRGGLTQLRSGNGPVRTRTYTRADGLAQNSVYSVHQNRDGTVWAGTLSGGVSRLQRGRFTTYTSANGLAANTVASLLEAADGTMWFATPAGLSSFSEQGWRTYAAKDGLPADNVNCVVEDSSGVLWAGTSAGLAFGGAGGFQAVAGAPAALREQILGMAEDRHGFLWVATLTRILRVRRDPLRKGTLSGGDVQEFGLADGLRGVEGVKRHSSVVRDPTGRIWFSLNRGISVVDPGRLGTRSTPAMVHVQSLSADGRALDVRGAVRIPPGS